MQLPDMNLLVALDALLDEGSVVGAAQRMNLSPAAMSRTLGRIRDALGDPILVRAGRGLVPTPRALALREQVHGLVEQAGQVFRSRDDVDLVNLDRAFNIRTNDLFIALYGAQLLRMMLAQAPHTVLRFVPEGSGDDDAVLRNGQIDLIISSAIELGPEIKVQSLFNTYFVGLAREGHPIFDAQITPERFAAYPQISVSRRGRANGPIDVAGANKATHFIQQMCQLGHPLIYLQNTTGYMVGKDSEQGGMIKHGSKMIQAVTNATVPQITIQCGASFGAGNYGMCGRGYAPRFLFSWPGAKTAVMGGEQAARTMQIVTEAALARKGITPDPAESQAQFDKIVAMFEAQADAFYTSGLLLDDGVIDPRDTRAVLAFCLDTCAEAQARALRPLSFGVARM